MNGSLGSKVVPELVGFKILGDLGDFWWFLGSNIHFLSVLCRFCLGVGCGLGLIVLSGGGLFRAGFLALFICVVSCRIH